MKLFSLIEFPRDTGLKIAGDVQPERVPKNVIFWAGGDAPFAELDDRLQAIVTHLKQHYHACDFANMDACLDWQRRGEKWGAPDLLQRRAIRDMEYKRVRKIIDSLPPTPDGCDPIFPGVKPVSEMASQAFPVIVHFAHGVGMGPLKPHHARFFCQPLGYLDWALDVNLMTGQTIHYPTYIEESSIREGMADERSLADLKPLLNSEAFKNLPTEIPTRGCDGESWFIEVKTDGSYLWKCHWSPPHLAEIFLRIGEVFQRLARQ